MNCFHKLDYTGPIKTQHICRMGLPLQDGPSETPYITQSRCHPAGRGTSPLRPSAEQLSMRNFLTMKFRHTLQ